MVITWWLCRNWLLPKENIEKEVLEETGLVVTAKELLAVYDTDKRKDIPQLFQYYKMIFSCEILENHPFEKNIETSNCAYFSLDNLPLFLSNEQRKSN